MLDQGRRRMPGQMVSWAGGQHAVPCHSFGSHVWTGVPCVSSGSQIDVGSQVDIESRADVGSQC